MSSALGTIEYTPQPEDLQALNAVLLARSRWGRWAPLMAVGLSGAIFALAAMRTEWPGGARWPVAAAALVGVGLGAISDRALGRRLRALALRQQARIMTGLMARQGLLVPQRLDITDEGLRAKSERGETLTLWSAVQEVLRTDGHVLLFLAPRLAMIVPRRAFASEIQFTRFADEATRRSEAARAGPPRALGPNSIQGHS